MRRRSRLGLSLAAALTLLPGTVLPGPVLAEAEFIGSPVWHDSGRGFGGFSSIELDATGTGFVAVTDRGRYASGHLLRDAAGRITKIEAGPTRLLPGPDGNPLPLGQRDSEGLAIAPDGQVYVSLEDPARVLRYSALERGVLKGPAVELPRHPDWAGLPRNRHLEALAVDARGRLYTLPEQTRDHHSDFPVYRFDTRQSGKRARGNWQVAFTLARQGDFLPVGADFGPDGRLYILERDFAGLKGVRSRIRRVDPATAQGKTVPGEVLLTTRFMDYGNLEGLAISRDAQGAIRATMIADDGFQFFLATRIVEYRLND